MGYLIISKDTNNYIIYKKVGRLVKSHNSVGGYFSNYGL